MSVGVQPDGWRHWCDFERALELSGRGVFQSDEEAIGRDEGRALGFLRLLARRTGVRTENLYHQGLELRAGVGR